MRSKPTIAFIYDFDGTLSPLNMQEFSFIPTLGMSKKKFWAEVKALEKKTHADEVLAYMQHMLKKAKERDVKLSRKSFADHGRAVRLFPGVENWFPRIDKYARKSGLEPYHFIISSGLKEMIEATKIAPCFKKIYACYFAYTADDVAEWPAMAINYTTKTQYLFRINKWRLKETDKEGINRWTVRATRPVPFSRMIYFGDGDTDIPCMRLVKDQGGCAIAIYRRHHPKSKNKCTKLVKDLRADVACQADYNRGSTLEKVVKSRIDFVAASIRLDNLTEKSGK